MAKYDPLFDFLKQQAETSVSLTFGRVGKLLQRDCRILPSFTSHGGGIVLQGPVMSAWLGTGCQVGALDLVDEKVTFEKV